MVALKKLELTGIQTETVHLFSAQSPKVLDLALAGLYRANASLSREPWDYGDERAMLHGVDPIWGFIPKSWKLEDYYDGEILETFRCEMSLPQRDSWKDFIILELVLPKAHVKRGITHNSSPAVVVFPYIMAQNVIGAYFLTDATLPGCLEGLVPRHYFKVATPALLNKEVGSPWVDSPTDFAQKYINCVDEVG